MKKQMNVAIAKTDEQEQTATGLVYAPLSVDSQGDFMTAAGIKAASQRFMKSGRTRAIDVNHDGIEVDAFIAESLISKGGDFPAGSWVVTAKIEDPFVWKSVREGKLTGFSMLGTGSRTIAKLNGKDASQISDLDVQAISLVSKAANKETFSVVKSDDGVQAIVKQLGTIAEIIQGINSRMDKIDGSVKEQRQQLRAVATGQPVHKSLVETNAPEITRQQRKIERLQLRLESLWENPHQNLDYDEADLRRRITKAEDKLHELGYQDDPVTIDNSSAFYRNGGRSNFLQASPSTFADILGVTPASQAITKSDEDAIDLNCMIF